MGTCEEETLSPLYIMEIKKFPVLSTGFGLKLMAENGEIYARVNNEENSDNGNLLVYGTTIDTVLCIKDGKPQMMPIFVPNNIFSDAEGRSFLLANEKKETEALLAGQSTAGKLASGPGDCRGTTPHAGGCPENRLHRMPVPNSLVEKTGIRCSTSKESAPQWALFF